MATAEEYAAWIVKNADKKGTPEFETVAKAYRAAAPEGSAAQYIAEGGAARRAAAYKAGRAEGDAIQMAVPNLVAGGVRGAGSIGATILYPIDKGMDLYNGDRGPNVRGLVSGQQPLSRNEERRQQMDTGLATMGAQPKSLMYGIGKVGSEVAGTAGMGGLVGQGVVRAAPLLVRAGASAPVVDALGQAAGSWGFRTGLPAPATFGAKAADLGIRSAGGGLTSATAAGLVDPSSAGGGAAVGAALPGAFKAVGAAGQGARRVYQALTTPQDKQLANKIAGMVDVPREDLISALTQQGPSMIPGYRQTVPQIVESPTLSQLQRTLHTSNEFALVNAAAEQQAAYKGALKRIAPPDISMRDAADRAGSAVQASAVPARKAATEKVRKAFEEIDPFDQSKLHLPIPEMEDAVNMFLGKGTFGTGSRAAQALETAKAVGTFPETVNFRTLQNLRSSIGEAAQQAEAKGAAKEAAALKAMVGEIDSRVNRAAGGSVDPREHFPYDMGERYRAARALHAEKMAQFETGPQAGLFRSGGDGQAALQGGEIPRRFYNGNVSQVEDMQSFKRLIGNNAALKDEMKRYAMTEVDGTTNRAGELTNKFTNWMLSRTGANRALLSPSELATLKEIGKAVESSGRVEALGRQIGPGTAQQITAVNQLGALDSKVVNVLANKIPIVGKFTGPMLDSLRQTAAQTRNNKLAELLADPEKLAAALQQPGPQSNALADAIKKSLPATARVAPVLTAQ